MGYYTKYFSTWLKGIWATTFKERREARRAIANLKTGSKQLYESLFEKVEKDHRVTKAIAIEKSLIERMKASLENAYKLLFNAEMQESRFLETTEEILKELHEMSTEIDKRSVSLNEAGAFQQLKQIRREIAVAIFKGLKKGESEERAEFKPVMLVINMAHEEHDKFMEAVRLAFKEKETQSILTRFAMRREISLVRSDINRLRKTRDAIIGLKRKISKGVELKYAISELTGERNHLQYLNDAFYESYLLKKRDMLIVLKALYDLNVLKRVNERWVDKNWMPHQPIAEKNKKIEEVEQKISREFHVIAQAFRIMIEKIGKLERVAQKMEAEAAASQPSKIAKFPGQRGEDAQKGYGKRAA